MPSVTFRICPDAAVGLVIIGTKQTLGSDLGGCINFKGLLGPFATP